MEITFRFGMLHTEYSSKVKYIKKEALDLDGDGNPQFDDDGKMIKKMIEIPESIPGSCVDSKCGRKVKDEEPCFIDTLSKNGDLYCDACGKCLRYERKMEARREEIAAAQSP